MRALIITLMIVIVGINTQAGGFNLLWFLKASSVALVKEWGKISVLKSMVSRLLLVSFSEFISKGLIKPIS
jgi:hypothetical protein